MPCSRCGSKLERIAVDCYWCKKCNLKHKIGFLHFMNTCGSNTNGMKLNTNVNEMQIDVNISTKTELHNELQKQLRKNFFKNVGMSK